MREERTDEESAWNFVKGAFRKLSIKRTPNFDELDNGICIAGKANRINVVEDERSQEFVERYGWYDTESETLHFNESTKEIARIYML